MRRASRARHRRGHHRTHGEDAGDLDALWTELLPGLGRVTEDTGARHELDHRLRALQLAPGPGAAAPPTWVPWLEGTFTVAREAAGSHSTLTSVAVRRHGDRTELVLREPGRPSWSWP